jgi:hypothetical protein
MKLFAIKLPDGSLYRPKKHGVKVYTRRQDAISVARAKTNGTVVTLTMEFK